jgi:ABC-type transporter Mla subunit MlaD
LFNAIEVASLFGTLELRDTATQTLRQFDSSLDRTAQNLQNIGGRLQGLGLAISAAVAPLVGFGAQGVRTAMTFDSAMAQISARTGTVGEDLERVRQLALQMGADTVFSAQDAADAMLELLASGQTVEQMMSTLPSVLTAAAASGEDLGTTADNITNILASFRLGVEDAGSVVDALSRAAGASMREAPGMAAMATVSSPGVYCEVMAIAGMPRSSACVT